MNVKIRNKRGNWNKTTTWLERDWAVDHIELLRKYGERGVQALSEATPKDTGLTAASWDYYIDVTEGATKIVWVNRNMVDGLSIALLIQYGHGTKNGGYVKGRDYINPAIQPVFDDMAKEIEKELRS